MSYETVTHPVYGVEDRGNCLTHLPHYYMPGLNTYLLSTVNNSQDAVGYYSASDRFNLPLPYVPFLEVEPCNNVI